jgi:hypothetical protein
LYRGFDGARVIEALDALDALEPPADAAVAARRAELRRMAKG